jgi:hypothetical protein
METADERRVASSEARQAFLQMASHQLTLSSLVLAAFLRAGAAKILNSVSWRYVVQGLLLRITATKGIGPRARLAKGNLRQQLADPGVSLWGRGKCNESSDARRK